MVTLNQILGLNEVASSLWRYNLSYIHEPANEILQLCLQAEHQT